MNLEGKVSRESFLLEVGLGKNEIVCIALQPVEREPKKLETMAQLCCFVSRRYEGDTWGLRGFHPVLLSFYSDKNRGISFISPLYNNKKVGHAYAGSFSWGHRAQLAGVDERQPAITKVRTEWP